MSHARAAVAGMLAAALVITASSPVADDALLVVGVALLVLGLLVGVDVLEAIRRRQP